MHTYLYACIYAFAPHLFIYYLYTIILYTIILIFSYFLTQQWTSFVVKDLFGCCNTEARNRDEETLGTQQQQQQQ